MKILFVLDCAFPLGVAFSSRARHLIKLLISCGHNVHIIAPLSDENLKSNEYTFENIKINKNYLTLSGIGTSLPFKTSIENYLKNNKVDLIISNNIVYVVPRIIKIAHKNNIPYIIDQCEWYDSSTFKFGNCNPYYRECMRMIEYKNKNVNGIISISRLFEKHYSSQGVKVIRIPTVLDIKNTLPRFEKKSSKIINILFAGSLGKGKEDVLPMIKVVNKINEYEERIKLHFYGPTKNQIEEIIGFNKDLLKGGIYIYGRIPQEEVENKVREADFTFIIRPNRRSSNAGFPTKLAESMAVGTPVIANNTGDIGLYIENKKNGFLLKEDLENKLFEYLEYILKMNEKELEEMRREARKTAEESFDYRNYINRMKNFLKEIRNMNERKL